MLNQSIAEELAMFLPIIKDQLHSDVYAYLEYKWGLVDGEWHSRKNALKTTGIQLNDSPEKVEKMAEELIIARHNRMYICAGCGKDYRKVGMKECKTGKSTKVVYVNQKGTICRTTNEGFVACNFGGQETNTYNCMSCGHKLSDGDETLFILNNGINKNSMSVFAKKFCSKKDKTTTKRYGQFFIGQDTETTHLPDITAAEVNNAMWERTRELWMDDIANGNITNITNETN